MNRIESKPLKSGRLLTVLLLLGAAGWLCYGPALQAPFLYDDTRNITGNPHIMVDSLSRESLTGVLQSPSRHRPLANLSFALNYYLHRYDVTGYHLVNLSIHILTALLIYVLTRQTLFLARIRQPLAPLLTSLVWLVHPLHIQSVTYLVQRMNALATMFYVLTLVCYIQARLLQKNDSAGRGRPVALFCLAGLSALLGFLSKEITATLPVFLFLYEWYFFKGAGLKRPARTLKWLGLIMVVSTGLLALLFLEAAPLSQLTDTYHGKDFTLSQRLLTEPRVVLYYLSLLAYPHPERLMLVYDFPLSPSPMAPAVILTALAALVALVFTAARAARREPLLSFAILWFLGNLAIESSVIGLALIYEHRTYLPSIFPVMAAVLLLLRHIKPVPAAWAALVALVVVNSWWTTQRNEIWSDRLLFWNDGLRKAPFHSTPSNQLGLAYARHERDYDRAIALIKKALETNLARHGRHHPDTARSYYNLAEIYRTSGSLDKAVTSYQKALTVIRSIPGGDHAGRAAIHNNLGTVYRRRQQYEPALDAYQHALNILREEGSGNQTVDIAGLLNNIGVVHATAGNHELARSYFERAVEVVNQGLGRDHPLAKPVEQRLRQELDQ